MKIEAIERGPMGITFHASKDRNGLFLQWSPYGNTFMAGLNKPFNEGGYLRTMKNPKYEYAKDAKEAKKLAEEFFAALGEDDE